MTHAYGLASLDIFNRGGTSRQNLVRVGYRVRKLNSGPGPGRVITTRNLFVSSFFHTVKSHYLLYGQKLILNKHVIVYEYVLCCLFPAATLKDNISHTNVKNVNE